MPFSDSEPAERLPQSQRFNTTHWSVVLAAREKDEPAAGQALEKLCRTYWPPLYAFIRREGHNHADAQDLTQAFFAHLLERDFLTRLEDQRGKFRSFLLAFLKHFLSDQRDRARAQKRGGAMTLISLDEFAAEDGYPLEPADRLTPDQVFERRWAQTVMAQALARLRDEYRAKGKEALYEQLKARRILVRYMAYAGYGDGLRISVGSDAETVLLLDELKRLI